MTQAEIEKIESTLQVALPSWYVDLVTNYPAEFAGTGAADYELLDDADEVISENRSVREVPIQGLRWPAQYFVVGRDGCGDLYVIKPSGTAATFGRLYHERLTFDPFANSIGDFIEKVLREYRGSDPYGSE